MCCHFLEFVTFPFFGGFPQNVRTLLPLKGAVVFAIPKLPSFSFLGL
uniref:Uncharacterized protein n=1 Tax=Rhizophora mucronata TaxID=61149 RepID=A0A2P2PLA2_RHIMU